ncbi:MAG: ferredoxin [Desulfuromonas sp.]|nr:MAG: ferredoxin [Desulfuromonas sp.]
MKIVVNSVKCQGSGECLKVCPHGALKRVNGKAVVDHTKCDLDGLCIPACPHDAIGFCESDE